MPGAKILAITLEPVSKQMAGPAIRCVELAKQLADEFEVTVFSPRPSELTSLQADGEKHAPKLVCGAGRSTLLSLAQEADILFVQGNVLKPYPFLAKLGKYLVVDLYDPYLLSLLAQYSADSPAAGASYRLMHKVLEKHMRQADFSICASERQRDYWLGRYCSLGRLTPAMYKFDPSFRKVIDVVPFGLPDREPIASARAIKGTIPGITPDDFVLLWGGGIWEWFDPLTVIEAVAKLSATDPRLKLYFMGWKSPNPQVPLMDMAVKARELAKKLNILDKHVFFCQTWTSYDERVNCLLDADVAISAHFDLPETRFSFRTRILDYLWAGLPILTTTGDQLAEMIERQQAGISLPYKNVDAWVGAIEKLLQDPALVAQFRQGSKTLSREFNWSRVCQPLRQFCRNPHHLPRFTPVRMPSLAERAHAVYSRGGKDLVLRRSRELLKELWRGNN